EMHSEPTSAGGEFLMALAGPVASAALGFLLFLLFGIVAALQGPPAVAGVLWYLSYLNWMLAVFNLLPVFPLDGGRMLRAALWGWRKDLAWATWIASGAGNVFGILLIVLGVIDVVRGDFVGGVWLSLIGLFLRGAASATYQQTLARQILGGQPVSRFMNRPPIIVPPDLSVREMLWGRRRGDGTIVAVANRWSAPMPQPNDLSRSLVALDQDSTIIAVVEMSQSSWLVAGMLPGIERQPRKKLEPSAERLLGLLHRWRDEAVKAGRKITRIALAFEAGRDGFWLARWLRA